MVFKNLSTFSSKKMVLGYNYCFGHNIRQGTERGMNNLTTIYVTHRLMNFCIIIAINSSINNYKYIFKSFDSFGV